MLPNNVVMGTITWKSHRYPHKTYVAHCMTSNDYMRIYLLVTEIPDYYNINAWLTFKH